ncbi:unnamed protein product, partial [Brassica oleracea]
RPSRERRRRVLQFCIRAGFCPGSDPGQRFMGLVFQRFSMFRNWARVLGHRRRRDASTFFNHHRPLSLEESHCRWRITVGEHRSYLHALSVM